MGFKMTDEQVDCVDKFHSGDALKINAYAGCGKTSTLIQIGNNTDRQGTFLAFNKSIADDAKRRFGRNVQCFTTHGLAFRVMRKQYDVDKMTGSFNGGFVARELRMSTGDVAPGVSVMARGMGFLVAETVRRFMRSGADEFGLWCVPLEGKLASLPEAYTLPLKRRVVSLAEQIWERMLDPRSSFPLGHDGYLKAWALTRPRVPGEFILLDEAQDTNGVVLSLMQHQTAQVVCVGDRHQQIYEWRGAQNAMTELPADAEARLTTSWRFGAEIAGNASEYLGMLGETIPLKGNPTRSSRVGKVDNPRAILCRTNARLLENLVGMLERDVKPHVVGGVNEILAVVDAAEKLQAGVPAERPLDFFGFNNWREVQTASEEEGGQELRRWVRVIDDYGVPQLRRVLTGLPTREDGARCVLATGHKSKGREWASVLLEDDFLRGVKGASEDKPGEKREVEPEGDEKDVSSELRLLYVAATRGMDAVELSHGLVDKINGLRAKAKEAA